MSQQKDKQLQALERLLKSCKSSKDRKAIKKLIAQLNQR